MQLHTDRAFEEQLGQLRTAVLEMGVLVEEQIGQAVRFFFSSRRRHTSLTCDWSSDVCSSDLLLDNFYVDAEVSADGHEWSMAAYATDFVEKTWPLSYGHNRSGKYPFPAEGNFPVAYPANGYLWDRAREAGISYRSYGEFVQAGKNAKEPNHTRVPSLQVHFDPWYNCFALGYADVKRAEHLIDELKRFETEGDMPK